MARRPGAISSRRLPVNRHAKLAITGTVLVTKGYVQASDVEPVIGALLTIGSAVWSVADKRGRAELPR